MGLLTVLIGGTAKVASQSPALWQFDDAAAAHLIPGCVGGGTLAGFEIDALGRPVVAWREENGCGGPPRTFWSRKSAGAWATTEFLSRRRYEGGAQADYAHQLVLRPGDGNPFMIHADVGPFGGINTYLADLGAYADGHVSDVLENLVGPQNCAYVNYDGAFGAADVVPQWTTGLSLCGGIGPIRLNGSAIEPSVYAPRAQLAVDADGTRHVLWNTGSYVYYTRWLAGAAAPEPTVTLMDDINGNGGEIRIAIDGAGVIHVIVRGPDISADWDLGAIVYLASADGGTTWTPREYVDVHDDPAVQSPWNANKNLSLAVDADGVPAVAFWRWNEELWYAKRDGPGGSWTQSLVTTMPNEQRPRDQQLRFDENGQPAIAFYDTAANLVRLARPVTGAPPPIDLQVAASVSPLAVAPGGTVTYTYTVKNQSATNVGHVVLEQTLPDAVRIVAAQPALDLDGRWSFALTSMASRTFTVSATAPLAEGGFVAVAEVSGADDADPSNNAATAGAFVRPAACFQPGGGGEACGEITPTDGIDVAVSLVATPSTVMTGGTFTNVIGVTNVGNADVPQVTVTNLLPGGATLVDTAPAAGGAPGTQVFSLGPLAQGETRWAVVRAAAPGVPGAIVNHVQTAAAGDVNPANDEASATVMVEPEVCFVAPDGLVARWRGNGSAVDDVGAHDGQMFGAVAYAVGRAGDAFSLNGTDSYVSVLGDPALQPQTFTIAAWVKPTAVRQGGFMTAVAMGSSGADPNLVWWGDSYWLGFRDGYPALFTYHTGNDAREVQGPARVAANTWHHLAASYDGSTARLYLDGALVGQQAINKPLYYDANAVPLVIGTDTQSGVPAHEQDFPGVIDEVSLHDHALTDAEVQAMVDGAPVTCVINRPPVAADDTADVRLAGQHVRVDVLANDSDPDGDPLTVDGIVTPPQFGQVTSTDGWIDYTADLFIYPGHDEFAYQVSDGHGGTSTATVRVSTLVGNLSDLRVTISELTRDPKYGYPAVFVTLTNDGPATATNAWLTESTMDGHIVHSRPTEPADACFPGENQQSCRYDTLAPGASRTHTVVVTPATAEFLPFRLTAGAISDQVDSNPDNNWVATTLQLNRIAADLGLALSSTTTTYRPGDTVTFTAVVTNAGPESSVSTALNVTLDGTAVAPPADCTVRPDLGASAYYCGVPPLGAGQQWSISFTQVAVLTGARTNRAQIADPLADSMLDDPQSNNIAALVTTSAANQAPVVAAPPPGVTVEQGAADLVLPLAGWFSDPDGDSLSYTTHSSAPDVVISTIDGTSLRLHFVPGAHGDATITVRATDEDGLFVEAALQVTVNPLPPIVLEVVESITVGDAVAATPAVVVNIVEPIHVGDAGETSVLNTPVGDDVTVDAQGPPPGPSAVTVQFAHVTQGGNTTYSVPLGLSPPDGFRFGNPAVTFDITTTAEYSGPVTVCLTFPAEAFENPLALHLFHFENGRWADRTTSVDPRRQIVCAVATSLSPFAVVEPVAIPGVMEGGGTVEDEGVEAHLEFQVSERRLGRERGHLQLELRTREGKRRTRQDRFDATSVGEIVFWDDPAFTPGRQRRPAPTADSVVFTGEGRWNGRPGYTFEVSAIDRGEPGRGRDAFTITIRDEVGAEVTSVGGVLTSGNIQSNRLNKEHGR